MDIIQTMWYHRHGLHVVNDIRKIQEASGRSDQSYYKITLYNLFWNVFWIQLYAYNVVVVELSLCFVFYQ